MKNYKIGIIGYGGFGKFLHYWWDKLENVEIIAISDSRYRGINTEKYRIYTDWRSLIMADDIDIVSIVTPPSFHAEMAMEAMKAGKYVLLEKPVAITDEDALLISKIQEETGMVIAVDHMLRYDPIIRVLSDLSQREIFGPLRHAEVSNYAQDNSLSPEHWFWDEAMSGGIMIEHGVHFFDLINAMTTQKVVEVQGISHHRNKHQKDQVSSLVKYDGGLIASHYHAFSGPGFFEKTTFRLIYDLARIEIDGWVPMAGRVNALVNNAIREELKVLPGWKIDSLHHVDHLEDVSRPEGWGGEEEAIKKQISVYGINYDVNEVLTGSFEIEQTKSEVYGKCLQDMLSDLIAKIENPDHEITANLENAIESLRIATLASK